MCLSSTSLRLSYPRVLHCPASVSLLGIIRFVHFVYSSQLSVCNGLSSSRACTYICSADSFCFCGFKLYDLVKDRDVVRCHVVEKDGRSKGFAFIDFRTKEQLNKAMDELDGYELGGRQIIFKEGRNSS
mmetsp:Transcript_9484/g.41004  ORF Transcript_9484/g.41004 Transcript_9484/m.41004 type:complete len:129 (+) Transcript_9484:1097-1483(+)